MKFSQRTLVPPATEPVTLAEAKVHCRVDISDDDAFIESLIVTAREFVEEETRRAFIPRTVLLVSDGFPRTTGDPWCGYIPRSLREQYNVDLPVVPVLEVTGVQYTDEDGAVQTLSPALYTLDIPSLDEPARLVPAWDALWPATRAVSGALRVTVVAGYANAAAVPQRAKHAMKLLIGSWYEHREEVVMGATPTRVPVAAQDLMNQLKWTV